MKTTENLKAKQFKYIEKPCHGGKGPWYFKDMLDGISRKDVIQYIHDDILPPGSEFGIHCHSADGGPDEEWYLCISGKGTMILDGVSVPFEEGDINVCRNGGSHGIINDSDKDLRFLVIRAKVNKTT